MSRRGDEDGMLSPDAAAVAGDEMAKSASLQLLKEVLARRRTSGGAELETGFPSLHDESAHAGAAGPIPPSPSRAVPLSRVPSGSFSLGHAAEHTPVAAPAAAPLPSSTPMLLREIDVTSPHAFQRVVISGTNELTDEEKDACRLLQRAMQLRDKHFSRKPAEYWGPFDPHDFPMTPLASALSPRRSEMASPVSLTLPGPAMPSPAHPSSGAATGGAGGAGVAASSAHASTVSIHPHPASATQRPAVATAHSTGGANGKKHEHTSPSAESVATPSSKYGKLFYRRRAEPPFKPFQQPILLPGGYRYKMVEGVVHVFAPQGAAQGAAAPARDSDSSTPSTGQETDDDEDGVNAFPVPNFAEFMADYKELLRVVHAPHVKSFSFRRLELLDAKFQLHRQLNSTREIAEQKAVPHRDFYNVRKCDTHVHHSACMNQKHLLRFIKSKLKKEADSVVIVRDGKHLTLAEVFESLSLTAYDLSIDTLDMHADSSTFHRFDRFNTKYNPLGQSRLREIFLKTDNLIGGRYLAEITREVLDDLESSKYQLAEYRLSVYGRSRDEWRKLAAWVVDNRLASPNVRWMIQVPRLYEAYKESGAVHCFQDMLNNIFLPLFEVTEDPSRDPKLHQFLSLVVGLDCVDDESKVETFRDAALPEPSLWNSPQQPPYQYWVYFLNANLAVLNKFRAQRKLTQISFRPHSGEAGDADHLAATFLTAEHINHGINLRKSPSLQYLYMLTQIGLALSPLSNNRLFLAYDRNPVYEFFRKGLNVSLSTDDPLMLSFTREPLTEEYAVAAQVFKLSPADMCEIARNSVLQSGFEAPFKAHWLGPHYTLPGPAGNDINFSNVPYIRTQYRKETLDAELSLLQQGHQASLQAGTAGTVFTTPPAPTHGHSH